APMHEVDLAFGDGQTTQMFWIGESSCAVPGVVAGLEAAHRRYGLLPWRELLAPAVELARDGVELTRPQAHMHAILDPILRFSAEGRRVYGRNGSRLVAGDKLRLVDLADTFEAIGRRGAAAIYSGERARAIVATVRDGGGGLTKNDLGAYRVVWRRPVQVRFRGHDVVSNPPPSSGGVLIAYGLALLERLPGGPHGSAPAIAALVEVMREQTRARGPGFVRGLHRGGAAARLLSSGSLRAALARIGEAGRREPVPAGG